MEYSDRAQLLDALLQAVDPSREGLGGDEERLASVAVSDHDATPGDFGVSGEVQLHLDDDPIGLKQRGLCERCGIELVWHLGPLRLLGQKEPFLAEGPPLLSILRVQISHYGLVTGTGWIRAIGLQLFRHSVSQSQYSVCVRSYSGGMASTVLAQVRFTIPSGEMVNTFAFSDTNNVVTYEEHRALAVAALLDFYEQPHAGRASIGSWMATWVERPYEIRTYNYADPPTRVPVIDQGLLPAYGAGGAATVPMDVAMCLSYHTVPPVSRRRRGRIYLGGVTDQAINPGSPGVPPQFKNNVGPADNSMMNSVIQAAIALSTGVPVWCIWSRAASAFYSIEGGYVDREPDTQRRRGSDSLDVGRVNWGT